MGVLDILLGRRCEGRRQFCEFSREKYFISVVLSLPFRHDLNYISVHQYQSIQDGIISKHK